MFAILLFLAKFLSWEGTRTHKHKRLLHVLTTCISLCAMGGMIIGNDYISRHSLASQVADTVINRFRPVLKQWSKEFAESEKKTTQGENSDKDRNDKKHARSFLQVLQPQPIAGTFGPGSKVGFNVQWDNVSPGRVFNVLTLSKLYLIENPTDASDEAVINQFKEWMKPWKNKYLLGKIVIFLDNSPT